MERGEYERSIPHLPSNVLGWPRNVNTQSRTTTLDFLPNFLERHKQVITDSFYFISIYFYSSHPILFHFILFITFP